MALGHLGVKTTIADLETERSAEANACRTFYDDALDMTLRDAAWPFSTKMAALALVEEDPNDEWGFSYRYPTDCVELRRLLSGQRNDQRQTRAPYRIIADDEGQLVLCDIEDAEFEYTYRNTDVAKYPSDFTIAFSLRLAALIAPKVTAGDPFKMAEKAIRAYEAAVSRATANSGNEEQPEEPPESEYITVRN